MANTKKPLVIGLDHRLAFYLKARRPRSGKERGLVKPYWQGMALSRDNTILRAVSAHC